MAEWIQVLASLFMVLSGKTVAMDYRELMDKGKCWKVFSLLWKKSKLRIWRLLKLVGMIFSDDFSQHSNFLTRRTRSEEVKQLRWAGRLSRLYVESSFPIVVGPTFLSSNLCCTCRDQQVSHFTSKCSAISVTQNHLKIVRLGVWWLQTIIAKITAIVSQTDVFVHHPKLHKKSVARRAYHCCEMDMTWLLFDHFSPAN